MRTRQIAAAAACIAALGTVGVAPATARSDASTVKWCHGTRNDSSKFECNTINTPTANAWCPHNYGLALAAADPALDVNADALVCVSVADSSVAVDDSPPRGQMR